MKEFVSIKRLKRQMKNVKLFELANQPITVSLVNDDGDEICPIPLIDCLCPGEPIELEEDVKMKCTFDGCVIDPKIVHSKCFAALEKKLMIYLDHFGHKTNNWSKAWKKRNIWSKKGQKLLEHFLKCRCQHGHFIRDHDAWYKNEMEIHGYESEPEHQDNDKNRERVRFLSDSIMAKWEGGTLYRDSKNVGTTSSVEIPLESNDEGYNSYNPPLPVSECVIC